MDRDIKVGQALEVIRLKVAPEKVESFLRVRAEVDKFTAGLKGFLGTEIVKVNDDEYLVLIRWQNEETVRAAQKITATADIITDWINEHATFISFETSISQYES